MENQKKLISLVLSCLVFSTVMLMDLKVFAQPACEWDGLDYCCGRIVPCNGGTYGPTGDYCLGASAPSPSLCPF